MLKSLIKLIAGAGLAQGIALLAAPILSRIYTPLEFGLFGIFMAFVGVLANVSTLRYEIAIPLPRTSGGARDLYLLSLLIAFGFSLLVGVAVILFGETIFTTFVSSAHIEIFAWLPISILGFALYQASSGWMARRGEINALSLGQNARAIAVALTQVAAGLGGLGSSGLVIGQSVGQMTASILMLRLAKPGIGKLIGTRGNGVRIWRAAKEYSSFPKHGALQALINSISQALLALLLGVLFGPAVAGFYVLAQRVVLAPIQIVASAVRQILTPRFARLTSRRTKIARLYIRSVSILALIGLPGVIVVVIAGPQIFELVFGSGWVDAGLYASVLVFALWGDLMLPPATIVLVVMQRQRIQLIFEVIMLLARLLAICAGFALQSALLSIAFFSAVGLLLNLILVLVVYRLAAEFDLTVDGSRDLIPDGGACRTTSND